VGKRVKVKKEATADKGRMLNGHGGISLKVIRAAK